MRLSSLHPAARPSGRAHALRLAGLLLAVACSDASLTEPSATSPDSTPPVPVAVTPVRDLAPGVTASSVDGALNNGQEYVGHITTASEIDSWTFTATQGSRVVVSAGEITGTTNFTPWLRIVGPTGTVLADYWDYNAAQVSIAAPATGTYTVQVGDRGADGTGSYRLTLVQAPGAALVVSAGDQGGPLTSGATHLGSITVGDIDAWTIAANQGDALIASMGEISGTTDFHPWIRLVAPNGTVVADYWDYNAAQVQVTAPVTGTYTLIVASYGSGGDDTGDYRLTMIRAPGPSVVSTGDEGGAMTNGAEHRGSITVGDIDAWQFSATQGHTVVVSAGEVSGTPDFHPWLRVVAPNGTIVGNYWDYNAAQVQFAAPATGTYTVIVASYGSGGDDTGDYRLSVVVPGPVTISAGDEGGTMSNGATYAGNITVGDIDPWRITASQGNTIIVSVGEISGEADFHPWIRLVAPNGVVVGNYWDYDAAQVQVTAAVSGTYTIVVASYGSGGDDTGAYRLSAVVAPGTITVSPGDQGGTATNGAMHTGTITVGDIDAWRISATLGNTIVVSVGEISGTPDFHPWIRLIAPNGVVVGNYWDYNAAQVQVTAAVTGTYTIVVASYGSGGDDTGDYRLTALVAPGTQTVSAGDQGGAMASGVDYTGSIVVGDVDAWRFSAAAGQPIAVNMTETAGTTDFHPWIRLVAPNGVVVGNYWDYDAAHVQLAAPAAGTYTVIVGTFGSGGAGTGNYRLRLTLTPSDPHATAVASAALPDP